MFQIPNKKISLDEMRRKTKKQLFDLIKSKTVHKLGLWYYKKIILIDILNYELNGGF